jgi:hypothetical protein
MPSQMSVNERCRFNKLLPKKVRHFLTAIRYTARRSAIFKPLNNKKTADSYVGRSLACKAFD